MTTARLSDKDRERYVAEGRCFECHETGHISRNCPSYSIRPDVGTSTELREYAEATDVAGTLSLHLIDIGFADNASVSSGGSMPSLQTQSDSTEDSASRMEHLYPPRSLSRGARRALPSFLARARLPRR